jgi:hypothetical protein
MNDRTRYSVLSTRFLSHNPPLITLVLIFLVNGGVRAETLRWKLKPGDAFTVDTRQETEAQVAFSGKSVTTTIDLALQQTWTVTSASEKEFVIKQTIDRIQIKLAGQQGTAEYDSAAKSRPSGQTRDLAASMQPLIGAEFQLTMTPAGKITAAKPANDAARMLVTDEAPSADSSKPASRGSVQQLLQQSLLVLPEKEIKQDDTWTTTADLANAAGKFQQEIIYRLAGTVQRGDDELLEIQTTTKLSPQRSMKTHEQTGKALFSAKDGRLIEAEQSQKLVTERPYRETTIIVTLSSKQKTTLTPKN